MAPFPGRLYEYCSGFSDDYFREVADAAASVSRRSIDQAASLIGEVIGRDGTIFVCGNGGSAAIANHLTCDYVKGARTGTGIKPRVYSLSTAVELITAISNDISYDEIFSFQLASMGRSDDLLIAVSASGNSPNILSAIETARKMGLHTIAMTGFSGGKASALADVVLWARANNYGVVEDVHHSLMHLLSQFLRLKHAVDPTKVSDMVM